jgi:hypothetical protein
MTDKRPVTLQEDESTGDRFLIYGNSDGLQLDIRYQGEQLWMTQAQIAVLYDRDISVISRHIASIFEEGELDESNLQKMQIANSDKPVLLYALDMIISVGYRVSSKQATLFRRWATDKLVQFATKGFVVDKLRLKNPADRDRVAELRDIIRDIRSDEANVYRELRAICAMCQDYNGDSPVWQNFYKTTQAKLVFAVTGKTPSEVIMDRANADLPNMGLTNWSHENIRKADTIISKNFLAEREVAELNRLTTILLDIFEDQMDIGRLKLMGEVTQLLDQQLKNLNRAMLSGGRSIRTSQAKEFAEAEYEKFKNFEKGRRHADADRVISSINDIRKALPKS